MKDWLLASLLVFACLIGSTTVILTVAFLVSILMSSNTILGAVGVMALLSLVAGAIIKAVTS